MSAGNWGTERWGLDEWGLSGGGGTLSLTGAFIDGERTLRASFSVPPLAQSTIGRGDALNPANWVIRRVQDGFLFTVMAVNMIDSVTFQPFTLQKFGDWNTQHELDVSALWDASSVPIAPPYTSTMGGCAAFSAAPVSGVGAPVVDLANVAVPGSNSLAGTLRTNSSGDYATQGGDELLRKLIYRRLITSPGEFFWLPGYGLGLKAKGLIGPARLAQLKAQVEKQVAAEPEVSRAVATLLLDVNSNVLTIQLSVTLAQNNQIVPLTLPVKLV